MPEYLSPAVYIEEVAGQRPIEAVSTSTTGMVGVTQKGPTAGKPTLVTSFAEFVDRFGGPVPEPTGADYNRWAFSEHDGGHWWSFSLAVRGFFDNGGRRLFVKRVLPATATSSSQTFTLQAVDGPDPDRPGRFSLTATGAPPSPTWGVRFFAKDRGGWSDNKLSVRLQPARARQVAAVVRSGTPVVGQLASALPAGASQVDVTFTGPDFATGAPGRFPVRIGRQRLVATFGPPSAGRVTLTFDAANRPTETSPANTSVQRLRPASSVQGNRLRVEVAGLKLDGRDLFYSGALILAGDPEQRFTIGAGAAQPGSMIDLTPDGPLSTPPPTVYEGDVLSIVEAAVDISLLIDGRVVSESFVGLAYSDDAPQPFAATINADSRLIDAEVTGAPAVAWSAFPGSPRLTEVLVGGADNLPALTPHDFAGDDNGPGRRTGVISFEDIEDINICAAPGIWAQEVRESLLIHCDQMRTRFAVLDPPPNKSVTEIMAFRAPIASKYAALYYPWLTVNSVNGPVDVAPSGHMAGLYARVDNDRGVHKAPANEVLRGISGLADDINQREQDLLNPVGINALRFFANRGNLVWGARTLSADPEWRYVNVRRLFLNIEESIRRGTQWVVFEPNAEDLWARVRQSVTDFLDVFWRVGALEGTTQQQAFFVRCDRSTMTEADIAAGRLVVEIGIAPVKPAEFVIFRFQQKTRDQVA